MNNREKPVWLTKNQWNYIQETLDEKSQRKQSHKKQTWIIIRAIDGQLGGRYPYNYTW